jgi:hypothetical protein
MITDGISWIHVCAFGATGMGMALLSCLVGMRQKLEIPAWWLLYVLWIVVVLVLDVRAPFRTILYASTLAGLLHGATTSMLMDQYILNNPWYAEQMQGPKPALARQFILTGVGIGVAFGALVGGIAWGLARLFS